MGMAIAAASGRAGLGPTLHEGTRMNETQGELDIDGDDDDLDAAAPDAIDLLQADHDEVQQLFEDYETLLDDEASESEREELAWQICALLTVHATLEDELLYPAARELLEGSRLVDVAAIEHATARALIAEIEAMQASDALFDARVTVLGEYVRHHVEEEEEELLPQLVQAGVDMAELGERLSRRKAELMTEMGIEAKGA